MINQKSNGVSIAKYAYNHDKNGNIVSESHNQPLEVLVEPQTTTYINGSDNQLQSVNGIPYSYDNNGNLIEKGSTIFQYDYENSLKSISTTQGVWAYTYDGQGRRVAAIREGVKRKFLVDPRGSAQLLAEYNDTDTLQSMYIWGLGLLYKVDNNDSIYVYHYNIIGSTVAITDMGETVVNKYAYSPFGVMTEGVETIENHFKYVGKVGITDEANGFLYMRTRYYDLKDGRFIQKDPIGFDGGVNLYAYAANNPVNWVDPLGLCKTKINVGDILSTLEEIGKYTENRFLKKVNPLPLALSVNSDFSLNSIGISFDGGSLEYDVKDKSVKLKILGIFEISRHISTIDNQAITSALLSGPASFFSEKSKFTVTPPPLQQAMGGDFLSYGANAGGLAASLVQQALKK